MKTSRTLAILMLCIGLLFGTGSCAVFVRGEGGPHSAQKKGWQKNSNNPHHYNSTNPGKAKGHQK